MIKRKIGEEPRVEQAKPEWLPLERIAEVEITSEETTHPIEAALAGSGAGWRAASAGEQTIRLCFPQPQAVRRVRIAIDEAERARTQEFVLRAFTQGGLWREVARQQFNFSPGGATEEREEYRVELPEVSALELRIRPDIGGGEARASLRELRVG